jgi:hypothetical protein
MRESVHLATKSSYEEEKIIACRCLTRTYVLRRPMQLLCLFALVAGSALVLRAQQSHKTENIVFVMTDGLRWQEVFRGAESGLINKKYGKVADVELLKKDYWLESSEDRRLALMPFLWQVVAKEGQIYGDRDKHSDAFVTNGLNFSYPGYSETLCGFADSRVKSNDKIPNPNVTVIEWLHSKLEYRGRVAAFTAWDVFRSIFNVNRAGFPVNAGYDAFSEASTNPRVNLLNQLKNDGPRVWDEEPFDAIPFYTAMEYLKEHKPRVLFVSFGETDDWAHEGDYAQYLNAAHRVDYYLRMLWETVQSMPEYRGKTTLIFSPDHGRGSGHRNWRNHGEEIPDSKYIWMAFLGPDTPPLGERMNVRAVSQNQIAATLAALLGENYPRDVPKAGQPIGDVLRH